MQSDQFARAKQLFGEVCDLPDEEQLPALRKLTDDQQLVDFVVHLLRQTQSDHPRASQPVIGVMSAMVGDEIRVGDTLGAWKLVAEIGRGGMGAVFRAERSDGQFEQVAAVKLLQGIPSARALDYLARERQILASLTHPNIARLYDGGTTPRGQPYLVMEHVEGVAIDRYCRDHKLSTHAILRLMLVVCNAISFAHQRLIIHCDIKPSNILVSASGWVMLLDFGIARLLGAERSNAAEELPDAAAASAVQTIARAYTPRYASPEQRQGGVLTTATDVYSLGQLLVELLRANQLASVSIDTELTALIAKATHEDAVKRYASASAMAADMDRYLQRLPLQVMAATPAYHARKFVQRKWPLLVAATVFTLVIGVSAQRILAERDRAQVAEIQAVKERDATLRARAQAETERDRAAAAERATAQQRDRATQAEQGALAERDRARASESNALMARNRAQEAERAATQTGDFLISIFENSTPTAQTRDVPASRLLALAETRLETGMQGQPALQSALFHTLGVVQKNMVEYQKSITLHERAIALERQNKRPLVLARMLFELVTSMHYASTHEKSLGHAREALALREKYLPHDAIEVGLSLSQVGNQLSLQGDSAAQPYLQRGLAILERADPKSENTAYALVNTAYEYKRAGDHDRAVAAIQRALAIRTPLYGELHELTLRASEQLSTYLSDARRFAESEVVARQNLAARLKLYGADNVRVAGAHRRLGESLIGQGRPLEAIAVYQKARDIFERGNSKGQWLHALVLSELANARDAAGEREAAINLLMEAQSYLRKLGPSRLYNLAINLRTTGNLLTHAGRHDEAGAQLREALELFRAAEKPNAVSIAHCLANLLDLAGAAGKLDEANRYHEELKPSLPLNNRSWQAYYLRAMARLAEQRGDLDEALRGYTAGEAMQADASGSEFLVAWRAKVYRAELLAKRGSVEDRRASARLAQDIIDNIGDRVTKESDWMKRLLQLAAQ
jgi:eukaryotic-like serine/threonine-protein kinase